MKVIHCADLHLGSRLSSLPVGKIRDSRKNDLLNSFNRLIEFAKKNEIKIIVLSGDVFDSDRPSKKDKTFFYAAIKANPEITFLYLRGNHDIEESLEEQFDNLLLFNDSWKTYEIEGISFTGVELSPNNKTSLYSSLSLNKDNLNIVLMHGDINTKGKDFIDIKKLANKNIDYLALGHIHMYGEYKIDSRGIAIYPGCLDGRGFDELGEKGFVVLDIDKNTIKHEFIPFSSRIILEKEIDISSSNLYDAKNIVQKELEDVDSNVLLKLVLVGKIDFDIQSIEKDFITFLGDKFFYLKVVNKVKPIIKVEDYKNDLSLKGEFVRTIASSDEYGEEEKEEILSLGIKLLNGEDIE